MFLVCVYLLTMISRHNDSMRQSSDSVSTLTTAQCAWLMHTAMDRQNIYHGQHYCMSAFLREKGWRSLLTSFSCQKCCSLWKTPLIPFSAGKPSGTGCAWIKNVATTGLQWQHNVRQCSWCRTQDTMNAVQRSTTNVFVSHTSSSIAFDSFCAQHMQL